MAAAKRGRAEAPQVPSRAIPRTGARSFGELGTGRAPRAAPGINAMAYATVIALAACAQPGLGDDADTGGERARYTIAEGDTLGSIAAWLGFPGGWRALGAANHLRGDAIRAGASLEVPVEYL